MYRLFLVKSLLSSPIHLPLIMFLDTPHRLWQCSCSAMQMIWMGCPMLMKYLTISFCRIIRIMQIPIMPGISGLDGHIMLTQQNDVEILGINFLQLSCIKHLLPPLWQTTWSMPAPEHPTLLLRFFP